MKSLAIGKNISNIEIVNIDFFGIWLSIFDKEYFLPYDQYPWFKEAKVSEILDVQLLNASHIYWPKLDVDLDKDVLEHPENYPLMFVNK